MLYVWVLSHVQLFATPWTVAHPVPLSMRFSRQEYWSRLPFPSPGDLPDPGIEHTSPVSPGRFFTTEPSGKPFHVVCVSKLPDLSVPLLPNLSCRKIQKEWLFPHLDYPTADTYINISVYCSYFWHAMSPSVDWELSENREYLPFFFGWNQCLMFPSIWL